MKTEKEIHLPHQDRGWYEVKFTFLSEAIDWDEFEYVPHQRLRFNSFSGIIFECPQEEVQGIMWQSAKGEK